MHNKLRQSRLNKRVLIFNSIFSIKLLYGDKRMNLKIKASLLMISLVLTIGLASAQNCEPQIFSKVTPTVFDSIKTYVQNYGISVPSGNSGEISYMCVSAYFMWDGESNLTIQFTNLPCFINSDTANAKLDNFINQFITP
jgi:hypothetical protein